MSAPITEAHREAAVAIFAIAMKSAHHGAAFREPCAQLIADSEAMACDQLRADCDYNHECINRLASATKTLGEKSERVVEVALSTIDQLRAELAAEREKVQLLKLDKDRLDWYNGEPYYKFGKSHKCLNPGWWWSCGYEQVNGKSGIKNIRDTIDSAMAHSKSGRNKYNVMKRLCETTKEDAK